MKKHIEKEIRRLFNPYAEELNFTEKDWRVFEARIEAVIEKKKSKSSPLSNPLGCLVHRPQGSRPTPTICYLIFVCISSL
jgi:hypothetical protein